MSQVDALKKLQALWNDFVNEKNENLNLKVRISDLEEELVSVREELSGLKEKTDGLAVPKKTAKKSAA